MFALRNHCACLLLTLFVVGCGGQPPVAPPAEDPDQLMEHWHALTEVMDRAELDFYTATVITERLAAIPGGLDRLLDVLGSDEDDPFSKLLALMCLQGYLDEDMEPRLIAFTDPEREQTTRTCATNLLGQLATPAALERLRELLDDDNSRVANAAYLVLLLQRDETALAQVKEFWDASDTGDNDREQFILVLPHEIAAEHLGILREAATNWEITPAARYRAIEFIVQFGNSADDLRALESAAAQSPEDPLRDSAQSGLAALKSRLAALGIATGEPGTPDEEVSDVGETANDEEVAPGEDDEPTSEASEV